MDSKKPKGFSCLNQDHCFIVLLSLTMLLVKIGWIKHTLGLNEIWFGYAEHK